jgi:hypothetical protein
MNKTTLRIYNLILATVCIITAFYIFELYSLNKIFNSICLLLLATYLISKSDTLKKYVMRSIYPLAILAVLKLIIFGF